MKKYSFIFIYKTTNTLNGMIYIGVHKTNNLNDGYMGSGKRLHRAIEKHGIEYFEREILEYFDTWKDALKREAEIVDEEFVERKDTYNITTGGGSFYHTKGTVLVQLEDGTYRRIPREEYWKNRDKYKTHSFGKVTVIDENGKAIQVTKEEYQKNKDKWHSPTYGKVTCIDLQTGENCCIKKEEFDPNRYKMLGWSALDKGTTCKDKDGNIKWLKTDDPRRLSGEYIPMWAGKKHTEESKRKIGVANSIRQKGKLNSQYGKCWIYNDELKECKSIKKDELNKFLSEGWSKGRKMTYHRR